MNLSPISVSVVIPTFNRMESLLRTITSITKQTSSIREIIVVDSSENPVVEVDLRTQFPAGIFKIITSKPSVCVQRNIGIKAASGDFVFLLDDDIEIEEKYLEKIKEFLVGNRQAKVATGLVLEKDVSGNWQYTFPKSSALSLIWGRIFQLGIWADLSILENDSWLKKKLKNYYLNRGNKVSKAGWPVLVNFTEPYFRSQIYGLGASVIQRDWLLNHLYEEKLDANGIGDNYGVAMRLKDEEGVFVLSNIHAFHHKEQTNRLKSNEAYFNRVKALHYFITTNKNKLEATSKWLVWSLIGNSLRALLKGNLPFVWVNLRLMKMVVLKKNLL